MGRAWAGRGQGVGRAVSSVIHRDVFGLHDDNNATMHQVYVGCAQMGASMRYFIAADVDLIRAAVDAGHPAIVLVLPYDIPHFATLTDCDDGGCWAHDPAYGVLWYTWADIEAGLARSQGGVIFVGKVVDGVIVPYPDVPIR